MQIIRHENSKLSLSEKGTIIDLTINGYEFKMSIPIYFLVFEKHSFENPVCRHLNDELEITNIKTLSNTISFHKKFEDVVLEITLYLGTEDIRFKIDTIGDFQNKSFGIVFPLLSNISKNKSEDIVRDLCLYYKSKNIATISSIQEMVAPEIDNYHKDKIVHITSEEDQDCSFFFHTQSETPCLRIADARNVGLKLLPYVQQDSKIEFDSLLILNTLRSKIKECSQGPRDVSDIMNLFRTCRHPGFLWEKDLLVPKKEMCEVENLIKQFEIVVFDELSLKDGYSADLDQYSAFVNIRCHMLALEGKVSQAIKIYEHLMNNYFDQLSACRKSCLLFSLSAAYLSDMKFEKSIFLYFKLSDLTLYSDRSSRQSLGISDSFQMLNMVYWYFMKHSLLFRESFARYLKISTKELWRHKKTYLSILDRPDWVACQIGKGFYQHAATKYPIPELVI